jgi:hypothetical protein
MQIKKQGVVKMSKYWQQPKWALDNCCTPYCDMAIDATANDSFCNIGKPLWTQISGNTLFFAGPIVRAIDGSLCAICCQFAATDAKKTLPTGFGQAPWAGRIRAKISAVPLAA